MNRFRGTGVAMVTPFLPNYQIDLPGLQRLTQYLIDGGVDYLVVLGTTGEGATLSTEEKDEVIRTIMETNAGRLPIVLGCGGNNTAEVARQIQFYTQKYAPDAFLSVSPYYNKPTQEGMYLHFREVAKHTPLPILLYNVPGRTATNMLPSTALRIAQECPNIIGIKEASGSMDQALELMSQKPSPFLAISGDDHLTLPYISIGYEGVICVVGNAFPSAYSTLVRHALAGNFDEARKIQFDLLKVMNLHFKEGNPAGIKASLECLGICGRTVRLPLAPASDALKAEIQGQIAKLSFP